MMLGFLGHDTRGASTGVEATEVAVEYEPDVVVLDLDLPDLDGREVARRIRERCRRRPRIIVITGWCLDTATKKMLCADVDDVVIKPIGLGTMRELIGDAPAGTCRSATRPQRARTSRIVRA
jgi:DNA-binding response OmpR family regulator